MPARPPNSTNAAISHSTEISVLLGPIALTILVCSHQLPFLVASDMPLRAPRLVLQVSLERIGVVVIPTRAQPCNQLFGGGSGGCVELFELTALQFQSRISTPCVRGASLR